jgi:hypothetical protein
MAFGLDGPDMAIPINLSDKLHETDKCFCWRSCSSWIADFPAEMTRNLLTIHEQVATGPWHYTRGPLLEAYDQHVRFDIRFSGKERSLGSEKRNCPNDPAKSLD